MLWLALGMHRGLLLSEDIRSKVFPWAPFVSAPRIASPALSDPVWQFVPWLDFAHRELAAGRLPLWNPHQDGGEPLLGNGQSALASPLVWPALAFGVTRGWNLSLLLRLLLALAGGYVWLRDLGRSAAAAALGAIAFALSGSFIAWLEHPHTLAAAPIPLLLLFARRTSRHWRAADFMGLALATFLVLAGGHPETAWMAMLLTGAVVVRSAPRPAAVFAPLGAALIGAGLAAPVLFPFVEYYRLSGARSGLDRHPFVLAWRDLGRVAGLSVPGSNVIEAAATVSAAVLAFAALGLLGARRDRDALFWTSVAAVIVLVTYDNPISQALAVRTPVYWTRALLLLPLPLGYLASGGLDGVREKAARAGRPGLAAAVCLAVPLAAAVELLLAARGVHGSSAAAELAPETPLLAVLRADRGVFRILPLHTFLPPNAATDYGLDDVRGYDALSPQAWRKSRASIGRFTSAPVQGDVIEPWDLAPGGAGLDAWNVRYLLLHPRFAFGAAELNARKGLDLEQFYAGPDGRILRNRRARERVRLEGPGRVDLAERTPLRWRFRVETDRPNRLTLADPLFPGWRAQVDGADVPLEGSVGDAIVARVPAGTHRVEIFYRPASFRIGILTALAAAVLLAVAARRRASPADAG